MNEKTSSGEPFGNRWTIVIVGIMLHLCFGSIYAYGVLRNPLLDHFKSLGLNPSAMDMTWPFIVFLTFFALFMPLAGPYIKTMGPKKVCMIGGVLCGIGWLAASFASSPLMLIPLYGIIGGIGVGIAYGAPITTSAQWFPDKRGLAVGLTVLGFGFSSAIITYMTRFLLGNGWGIMNILRMFGIVFIVLSIVLSMMLRLPSSGWKPSRMTTTISSDPVKIDFMREQMIGTSAFKGLWICYTIGALAGLTAIGIAGPVGKEVFINAGMSNDAANNLIFALILPFAIFNGLGRPIFGVLTDKLSPKRTAIITYVLIILACLTIYIGYSSILAYIISFCILWGCLGGWLAIAPTATASYFGMRDNARNYGVVYTAYGAGAIIGGIVSAQAKDILGAFQPFFLIVAGLAVLGIILALGLLKPPTMKSK
ncbi:MAG: OFA family MFS transporter [Candidatus Methanofastidiosa archaeon]|jgi:OFA family oxalate/formate antiporter-like MFS transporter|nr:OFA family MFS transporter [Candidatus Methanofastidiosa archaeon]HOM96007.1 OFA family MFS transporter [Methanofastidiosum sp.]HPC81077.1 OFA family MFS transporter [Methanofastidiosum sp.]HRS25593.1 OFA family MFS transporter [Methanofastidiosum sp.]